MSDEPAATDRGMWRVVASRDFWVRLHDKGFVISTSITLAVLTIFILIRAYGGGPDAFTLGVVGNDDLGRRVSAPGERSGLDVTVVRLDDAPAADASLRDGDVDAVVLGDVDEGTATLRVLRDLPDLLDQLGPGRHRAPSRYPRSTRPTPQETIDELNDRHPVETSRSSDSTPIATRRPRSRSRSCCLCTDSCSATACGSRPA